MSKRSTPADQLRYGASGLPPNCACASSPDISRWTVVANTYPEAHQLAEEGVRFALERDDLKLEHYVPVGVAVAA